jgi:hypothetical protein
MEETMEVYTTKGGENSQPSFVIYPASEDSTVSFSLNAMPYGFVRETHLLSSQRIVDAEQMQYPIFLRASETAIKRRKAN